MNSGISAQNPSKTAALKNRLLQMDHLDAMIAYWDKDLVCRFANTSYMAWFGKLRQEMVNKITLAELLGPLYHQYLPHIQQALSGNPQQFEREIIIPSGEKRYSIANYYPDIIDGEVRGFYSHIADISKLKNLEFIYAASEKKFKNLLENAPDAMVIVDMQGIIHLLNSQTEKLFGFDRSELIGEVIEVLFPHKFRNKNTMQGSGFLLHAEKMPRGTGFELLGLHKSGKEFPVEISIGPIEMADGIYVSAAIRNITDRKQAEIALNESNKRNKIFVQQSPHALAMLDNNLRYLAVSRKWLMDYNLGERDIIGQSHYDVFPQISDERKKIHQECLKGKVDHCNEYAFEKPDGTIKWLEWDVRPWYLNESTIGGLILFTADITSIKEKEQEKRNIEEILDKTNEIARIGTWEIDLITTDITWSRVTREILEIDQLHVPVFEDAMNLYKEGESRKIIRKVIEEAITLGKSFDVELQLITFKGNETWVRVIGHPEYKKDACIRLTGIFQDITQQKTIELELAESNNRSKIFIQQSPNAIAMFDKDMKYLAASRKWLEDYQLDGKDILGHSHYKIFPRIGEEWKKIHSECLNGAINKCDEAAFERFDGTIIWITWDVRPWYISEKNIGGLIIYTADITALKDKDKEKRRIEEILDKTNEVARIGTWEFTLHDSAVKWSRMVKQIHEVEDTYEPVLEKVIEFYTPESKILLNDAIQKAVSHGTNYDLELEIITAKKNHLWVRGIGQSEFKNGVCTRLYGVFQDIDESKRDKQSLSKLNNELKAILNSGHVSIIGTDLNGLITHFNKGAEHLLQYSAVEMVGLQKPFIIHVIDEIVKRGKELSERFGHPIEGDAIMTVLADIDELDAREWTYVRKDGTTFPVQLIITAIKNDQGQPVGYLGVATDITEIKNAQREMKSLLEITTDQNERLKNFAHIVSHNLRSHSGNIDMILDLYIQDNPAVASNEYIPLLKKSSENLKETIANLNEIVLINTNFDEKLVPLHLYQSIESAMSGISQIAKEAGVTIQNEVDKTLIIQGLPAYIDSILLNFISNGIKYRSANPHPSITLSANKRKDFIELVIADNGIGIDLKKYGSRLFGMYKTFHGNADARGIGLFITKNQVEAVGGKIEVDSTVGVGTTFKIYFKNEKN